jgi:flagellar biosynthetic protein FliS
LNPYKAYQQNRNASQTRIDVTLALYEEIMGKTEKALAALRSRDQVAAQKHLAAAHLGIAALASAFDARAGELAFNLLRLYEFVGRCLMAATTTKVEAALTVLRNLYEGFLEIRSEAVNLERSGAIAPVDQVRTFHVNA